MRKCVDCKETKPFSEYHFSIKKNEHSYVCKPCTALRNRAYYKANRRRVIAQVAEYADRNRAKVRLASNKANKAKYQRLRQAALDHYGRECACCGERMELFLCIDHVDNDGAKHRKQVRNMAFGIYNWFAKHGYPKGFQTLCQNCNWAKHTNGGSCPHKGLRRFND